MFSTMGRRRKYGMVVMPLSDALNCVTIRIPARVRNTIAKKLNFTGLQMIATELQDFIEKNGGDFELRWELASAQAVEKLVRDEMARRLQDAQETTEATTIG